MGWLLLRKTARRYQAGEHASVSCLSGFTPNRCVHLCAPKDTCENVPSGTGCDDPRLEATQMPSNGRMGKFWKIRVNSWTWMWRRKPEQCCTLEATRGAISQPDVEGKRAGGKECAGRLTISMQLKNKGDFCVVKGQENGHIRGKIGG